MFASLVDAPLEDKNFVYEPKYDGIRAIVEVGAGGTPVRLWSRLGNEKTAQFPEIAGALSAWARRRKTPLVLDGEIVALDGAGKPIGFQNLQGRIHIGPIKRPRGTKRPAPDPGAAKVATAFFAFDLLKDGALDWRTKPLTERRRALEKVFRPKDQTLLRLSEQVRGDGRELHRRALAEGWEGLIAKRAASLYFSGKRTPDWRKVKIVHEQEFVVGGWTEPRQTRSYFGSLLLGVFEGEAPATSPRRSSEAAKAGPTRPLIYAGHVGTGFNERELGKLMKLLKPIEIKAMPFAEKPASNEKAHWVEPKIVVQVRFGEWTADGVLRHPVYLGLRDDKEAGDVRKEEAAPRKTRTSRAPVAAAPARAKAAGTKAAAPKLTEYSALVSALQDLENSRRDGVLELPGGGQLKVSNLHKVFWPAQKYTKGDLFRYYAQVAPFLLPVLADRPLVMKRFPNGVAAKPFYQHRAEEAPAGVRLEALAIAEARPQLIGGDIATLMYTTQLAAISQDPWFSRVQSLESADHIALDLDPPDNTAFTKVLDVARYVHDALEAVGAPSVVKTSGASGLHIYVPLPADTPYEAGALFAEIIATMVAQEYPKLATVERTVKKRGSRIYVDFMQNGQGKTLASAYSARASDYAGVSTPLTWNEVHAGVKREDFTIKTVPDRLREVGDLWAALRSSKAFDLSKLTGLGV